MAAEFGPEDLAACLPVSRETLERLQRYVDLLVKWQAKLNLVSAATLPEVWRRHILDSAQLHPLLTEGQSPLVDLGSGAGFPGLVLAIMGGREVHLIESDARKSVFLREAARITGAPVQVHTSRIEQVAAFPAAYVTARALAPLDKLLGYAAPFLSTGGVGYFAKGKDWREELTSARRVWTMATSTEPSLSDPLGVILRIEDLRRGPAGF